MELDVKYLKMTDRNKAYGIGPTKEVGSRPTDTQIDSSEQDLLFITNIGNRPNF